MLIVLVVLASIAITVSMPKLLEYSHVIDNFVERFRPEQCEVCTSRNRVQQTKDGKLCLRCQLFRAHYS